VGLVRQGVPISVEDAELLTNEVANWIRQAHGRKVLEDGVFLVRDTDHSDLDIVITEKRDTMGRARDVGHVSELLLMQEPGYGLGDRAGLYRCGCSGCVSRVKKSWPP
jgi:hypothetical protein